MADDPIVITGGSLTIQREKGNLKHGGGSGDVPSVLHPEDGEITGVTIDGTKHTAHAGSKITIHYEVPKKRP